MTLCSGRCCSGGRTLADRIRYTLDDARPVLVSTDTGEVGNVPELESVRQPGLADDLPVGDGRPVPLARI
jgi:hypothetical protein